MRKQPLDNVRREKSSNQQLLWTAVDQLQRIVSCTSLRIHACALYNKHRPAVFLLHSKNVSNEFVEMYFNKLQFSYYMNSQKRAKAILEKLWSGILFSLHVQEGFTSINSSSSQHRGEGTILDLLESFIPVLVFLTISMVCLTSAPFPPVWMSTMKAEKFKCHIFKLQHLLNHASFSETSISLTAFCWTSL